MKQITFAISMLIATTMFAQNDSIKNKKPPVILDCETLYPERILNHDPINPDFYTYDHSEAKERCIEKNATLYANASPSDTAYVEYLLMKEGKMVYVSKQSNSNQINKNFTLSDGTVVISNGTIIRKDGSKTILKEKDYITLSGIIFRSQK